jgi:hypothetical protein
VLTTIPSKQPNPSCFKHLQKRGRVHSVNLIISSSYYRYYVIPIKLKYFLGTFIHRVYEQLFAGCFNTGGLSYCDYAGDAGDVGSYRTVINYDNYEKQ